MIKEYFVLKALTTILLLWTPAYNAKSDPALVTCGSSIKIENHDTKHNLHSHEVNYGGGRGSGQQSVTGFSERNSAADLWVIRGAIQGDYCLQGTAIKKDSIIRLQHAQTRRWLHSHAFFSPITNQQEVSCNGSNEEGDEGDDWIVEWDAKNENWQQDTKFRLKHKISGSYLGNHNVQYQRPIPGQTEVFAKAFAKGEGVLEFKVTEGIFFPINSRVL